MDVGPLDSVIQRNKKSGTGLSPFKKIKAEEDSSMDVAEPSCTDDLENSFLSVSELPNVSELDDFSVRGPRNDTGAELTGHTDN